ncbi:cytidine deaminase-like protein [Cylindrobasidium torrendii FP15055 ss-10]|uniref:Cytidine deaminase-like protein n=1 Tax=Cylindrobasidium torrendii FP15055 ss-10 TaxID=1314674 RepID=A0A0D7BJ44_9AGAR|nr:cytidine deaminase-like protein [Cylindrobasidium torrendii FP15055 ss-10]
MDSQIHRDFMLLALEEAKKCVPSPGAFCVGCVIVLPDNATSQKGTVLSAGYSRELPGNTHAEANALQKLHESQPDSADSVLANADVYTTMEPCSVRTSGLAPCADALIKAGVKRCIIGVGEPDDFVQCEGAQKLQAAGVELVWLKGLEEQCLSLARTGAA